MVAHDNRKITNKKSKKLNQSLTKLHTQLYFTINMVAKTYIIKQ